MLLRIVSWAVTVVVPAYLIRYLIIDHMTKRAILLKLARLQRELNRKHSDGSAEPVIDSIQSLR